MGKPKNSLKKKKSAATAIIKTPCTTSSETASLPKNATVDQLLEQAEEYENQFEAAKSLKLYNRVLSQLEGKHTSSSSDPTAYALNRKNYVKALQGSAFNLLELGKPTRAKERLVQVLQTNTDVDYEVYMYLGQLTESQDSLGYYRQGLEALRRITSDEAALTATLKDSTKSVQTLQRAESNAFCAIAELYMTDLCDSPEAETECKKAFDGACQTDPGNPQAWLTAANYQTITGKTESARDSVQRCLDLWWSKLEKFQADNEDVPEETSEKADDAGPEETIESPSTPAEVKSGSGSKLDLEELTGIPSSGLISLARILIELEIWEQKLGYDSVRLTEEPDEEVLEIPSAHQKCASILEALLEEEEDNLEVYYLLTVVGRHLWLEEDPDLLRLYATTARVIAGKLGDVELETEMVELLNELPDSPDEEADDALENYSTSDEETEETNEHEMTD